MFFFSLTVDDFALQSLERKKNVNSKLQQKLSYRKHGSFEDKKKGRNQGR